MRLVIIGAAGSGKGTLAERIKKNFTLDHVSTGDMFRSEISNRTPLGIKAKEYIDGGHLVPDELTIAMVANRLHSDSCQVGFLLDGFPRTLSQAIALDKELEAVNKPLELVINLKVDDNCLKERITGRRICPNCKAIFHTQYSPSKVSGICDVCGGELIHRSDDTPEQLEVRLREFYKLTGPVLSYYRERQIVVDLDATQLPDHVWDEVYPFLKGLE